MDFREFIENKILLFDGAMGTMLQSRGLKLGELPERYNLTHPELVTAIHREYVEAGADVVSANTFQAHELKLDGECSVEELVEAGIKCAKASGARFVALDVGPAGQLLEPMGTLSFERAYEVFARQMIAGEKAGADLILIETVSDLYEAKAAILAAKENTSLPVICSMTFQEDGRSFVGCDALTMTIALQGLGVDALGVNCSLGPEKLKPIVETILKYSRIPVIVQANAGLPEICCGDTHYAMPPEEYVEHVLSMLKSGVHIVGGCCGTTPEHIRMLRQRLEGFVPVKRTPLMPTACTSGTKTVLFESGFVEIGERLNPTGKKAMQRALREGDNAWIASEAISQTEHGATVLDVNVGLPDIDESACFSKLIREIQGVTGAPLQIDSADPAAIETAVRIYNGRPIINSVNGKTELMERVFPIAKKYGALVVGLTLDENGIPPTAEGRLEIARKIRDTARRFGLRDEELLVDCLVLTASAQQTQVIETVRAIRMVKSELGLKTVLGVSNVSFGLPERDLLNANFLAICIGAGLDSAIINPYSQRMKEALDSYKVLDGEDENAAAFISKYTGATTAAPVVDRQELALSEIIERGLKDKAASAVQALLENTPPLAIIDSFFVPALTKVGLRFESGEIFLPQLMLSAQAVQNGFAVISAHMGKNGEKRYSNGSIVLATVKGDIHDIGKNIVKMLLENYGFEVIDLGKDVPIESLVHAVREKNIRLVGLSALMTTTVRSMKETIAAVREAGLNPEFFVGGAVLTKEYAAYVGAEHYAKDAMESVAIAKRFFEN